MSVTLDDQAQRGAYWPLPIARAIPAAALAIVITFSADHSARFGLLAFGGFAIVTGAVVTSIALRRLAGSRVRPYLVAQGVVSVVLGAASLAATPLAATPGGVPAFFLVVTTWAAITGALELYSGVRSRRRFVASGDWLAVGGFTALAAIVFVLLPTDFREEFTGAQKVSGVLDSSIIAVGLLGAYAAIIAVFLVIAGLSARWGTSRTDAPAPVTAEGER